MTTRQNGGKGASQPVAQFEHYLANIRRLEIGAPESPSSPVHLTLERHDTDPKELKLSVMLEGTELCFCQGSWDDKTQQATLEFEVTTSRVLRDLSRSIAMLADRAEREGMFTTAKSA